MDKEFIKKVINKWDYFTCLVLDLKEFSSLEMHSLLQETYYILKFYSSQELVPKEISKLLLMADEFLYFASMEEKIEKPFNFYNFQAISCLVEAFKNGFFTHEFKHQVKDNDESTLIIEVQKGGIAEYLKVMITHPTMAPGAISIKD